MRSSKPESKLIAGIIPYQISEYVCHQYRRYIFFTIRGVRCHLVGCGRSFRKRIRRRRCGLFRIRGWIVRFGLGLCLGLLLCRRFARPFSFARLGLRGFRVGNSLGLGFDGLMGKSLDMVLNEWGYAWACPW